MDSSTSLGKLNGLRRAKFNVCCLRHRSRFRFIFLPGTYIKELAFPLFIKLKKKKCTNATVQAVSYNILKIRTV